MATQPTPQGISALLRKAGFDRSVSQPSRIRGFREYTEGFKVSKDYDGGVLVEWLPSSFRARGNNEERERDMLNRYHKAIEEAGFAVDYLSTALTAKLLVTAAEET